MEDIDLQFDIDVPFETDKKTKKPFPGDFSFNADGLLEDCELEEMLAETFAEPEEVQIEPLTESFDADFDDVVEADFIAEDFEEDDDDAELWDEFRSVFEEDEIPAAMEEVAEEPVVSEPEAVTEPEMVAETETPAIESDEEDESDEAKADDEPEAVEEIPPVPELEALVAERNEEVSDEGEGEDEDDDLTLWAEVFQDVSDDEPEAVEEIPPVSEPEAVTEPVTPAIESDEDDDGEEFDFPEDPDADCDFVAVPKPTISVTTWEQIRARAKATTQNTYETEHFFAVEEDYSEHVAYQPKPQAPAEEAESETEEESIQPIWYVDDPEHPEETPMDAGEISDEEMDYDDIFNDDRASYRKKKKRKNLLKKILKEFCLFLAIIIGALFLVTNFTIFVSRQNTVVGHSMEPTLHGGDHVYTSKLPYIFGDPKVGDIVVIDYSCHQKGNGMSYFHMMGEVLKNNRLMQFFKDPSELKLDEYWIKRVVAVAGDTVSFKDNQFYRNGELVEEDYILEQTVTKYANGEALVVPEGQVFVMGDNRNNSSDSRIIGCIDIDVITGKVWKKG